MKFEEGYNIRSYDIEPKGIVGFLIKKNIVKDKDGANKLLLILLIIFTFIPIYLLWPDTKGFDLAPDEIDKAGSIEEITNT